MHEKLSNLKFIHEANRTGKLCIQFMYFVSIVRMFVRAERTGDWNQHIHAPEQMLPFLQPQNITITLSRCFCTSKTLRTCARA